MFVALIKRVKKGGHSDRDVIKAVKALQDKPEAFLADLDKVVRVWQAGTGKPVTGLTEAQRDEFNNFVNMARKVKKR